MQLGDQLDDEEADQFAAYLQEVHTDQVWQVPLF